jgi:DNA-binding NtrC family response regulator
MSLARRRDEKSPLLTGDVSMGARLHVLVMEHDLTIRLALAHALKRRGADVHACTSLKYALEAIQNHPFDVILADLQMRGHDSMDGLNLLKVVREIHPMTRVIIMTACGSEDVETEVEQYGGTYWAKSWDLEELLLSVMSVTPAPQTL